MNKKNYGQFYTTNYKYILDSFIIPDNLNIIIEPFAGNGDLLNIFPQNVAVECYDIEPKQTFITKRDTLLNPPIYCNKYVITNPPYLARNKSDEKAIFNKYNYNDLYKCFIECLINDPCIGGILIIPLNFWSSIRRTDCELRQKFINTYYITRMNVFEEQVFNDTSYTVCSFQFVKRNNQDFKIKTYIYPDKKEFIINLDNTNNYTIGGEIYNLPQKNNIIVERLTSKNINSIGKTNILLKCIDDNENSLIRLQWIDNPDSYADKTPNLTGRSYASIVITPSIEEDKQKKLIIDFNEYLMINRNKYNSLFLTNYRESKNKMSRKRISFQLAFEIINYLVEI